MNKQRVYVVSLNSGLGIEMGPLMVFTNKDDAKAMTDYITEKLPHAEWTRVALMTNESLEYHKAVIDSLCVEGVTND
jgi:hypothetical protein